jgi:acyl dehydratase
MCVVGMATQGLMRVLADDDPTRLRAMEMRFAAPLFAGETLRLEAWADGSFRARSLERDRIVLDHGRMKCALPALRRRT